MSDQLPTTRPGTGWAGAEWGVADLEGVLAAVLEERTSGLVVWDASDGEEPRITYATEAFAAMAGRAVDELIGSALSKTIDRDLASAGRDALDGAAGTGGAGLVLRPSGDRVPVRMWCSPAPSPTGRLRTVAVVAGREAGAELWGTGPRDGIRHDPLTGLPDRAAFADELGRMGWREGRLAMILLDLDRFKLFNDTHGHGFGDDLLVAVADRVRSALRPGDLVARLGGDEFAVCVRVDSASDAMSTADRIRLALVNEPFEVAGHGLTLTASIGVAIGDPGAGIEPMLRDADAALYASKDAGRNRVRMFDEGLRAQALRRLDVETRLRHALDADLLELHYQPSWDLRTGTIGGVEALLRWSGPGSEAIGPDEFLPVAEDSDLIEGLGRWVIDQSCAQLRLWRDQGHHARRTWVNVSARELARPTYARNVLDTLAAHRLDGHELGIEVTERCLMDDADIAARQLAFLRAAGLSVAIDHFGTGYSSLSSIAELGPDCIKIDRSFVDQLGRNRSAASIVEAVVRLAHSVGAIALADGVESEPQLDILRELGCDAVAGFLLCPPLPAMQLPDATPELLSPARGGGRTARRVR